MSRTPESPESLPANAKHKSRKSHQKSRNGCQNCKQRRVKCGEQKPNCSNCLKHSSRCVYSGHLLSNTPLSQEAASQNVRLPPLAPSPPSKSPMAGTMTSTVCEVSPEAHISSESCNPPMNVADLELLHNYDTSTVYSLATIPALQKFFRVNVPPVAFSHPFLLHAILAVSALQLSHSKRDPLEQAHYLRQAYFHYNTALPMARSLLESINEKTCSALYIFSTLSTIFTLGMGPKRGDFFVFGENRTAEWLIPFRGLRMTLESHPGVLEYSELSPLLDVPLHQVDQSPGTHEILQELRQLIINTASDGRDVQVYLTALDELARCFHANATSSPSTANPHRSSPASPQTILAWLYRLSDEFVQRLQRRDAIALVILAHFCVLLHHLGSLWWVDGWVEHLLSEIYECLGKEKRLWMVWVMEEVK